MSGPVAAVLPGGRLHLQHGPIDLVIRAEGPPEAVRAAYRAARRRFGTVLAELVEELPALRRPVADGSGFHGAVAQRMAAAVRPHGGVFVTPMAAVAGSVADEILAAMLAAAPALAKAWVNNGGDIAVHLAAGQSFSASVVDDPDLTPGDGVVEVSAQDGIRGIATSGRGGRSLSLGIADAVTVLAACAAAADAAATLIANAVDLPGHPAIRRAPAREIDPDSDLGERDVVVAVGDLTPADIDDALAAGLAEARRMAGEKLIAAALLSLGGQRMSTASAALSRAPALL
jgi:hypothetical protein